MNELGVLVDVSDLGVGETTKDGGVLMNFLDDTYSCQGAKMVDDRIRKGTVYDDGEGMGFGKKNDPYYQLYNPLLYPYYGYAVVKYCIHGHQSGERQEILTV